MRVTVNLKEYRVHRLIAETFIDNPDAKPTVDHINRIRDDNRLCNLRWAKYRKKRVAWEIRTGRRKSCTVE